MTQCQLIHCLFDFCKLEDVSRDGIVCNHPVIKRASKQGRYDCFLHNECKNPIEMDKYCTLQSFYSSLSKYKLPPDLNGNVVQEGTPFLLAIVNVQKAVQLLHIYLAYVVVIEIANGHV